LEIFLFKLSLKDLLPGKPTTALASEAGWEEAISTGLRAMTAPILKAIKG
jgi:hypothetical protein